MLNAGEITNFRVVCIECQACTTTSTLRATNDGQQLSASNRASSKPPHRHLAIYRQRQFPILLRQRLESDVRIALRLRLADHKHGLSKAPGIIPQAGDEECGDGDDDAACRCDEKEGRPEVP